MRNKFWFLVGNIITRHELFKIATQQQRIYRFS